MGRRLQTVAAVTCMKTLLMVFNFIFWATGIALLVIGIWMKISLYQFLELSDDYNNAAPYIFIGTGAGIIIVGFLACCCTAKGQPALLYMLAAFLVLVFILELSAGISGYVYRSHIRQGFQTGLNKSLHEYGKQDYRDKDLDMLQKSLGCCGVYNYTDWFDTKVGVNNSVPHSCCRKRNCQTIHVKNTTEIYPDGCYNKVVEFVNANLGAIGAGALGIACFQLLGVMLSCCLAKHINKAKYEQMT